MKKLKTIALMILLIILSPQLLDLGTPNKHRAETLISTLSCEAAVDLIC